MENFLIKLMVKIDYLREPTSRSKSVGTIDIDLMKEFGLPAESLSDLNKLEDNLQNNKDFKAKLVIFTKHLNF